MPEFQLDYGDQHKRFRALDYFTQGYIECAFFCGVEGVNADQLNLDMLADATWTRMIEDCARFQHDNETSLAAATVPGAAKYTRSEYNMTYAGHDFWYTRNGHGAGYYDRGLPPEVESALCGAAHAAGEIDLYKGDDSKLYL